MIMLFTEVERDREERKERDPPKRGNTIYIHGLGITEDIIRRTFSNFGNIVHINMEKEKK
jgi:negative elongation factor E